MNYYDQLFASQFAIYIKLAQNEEGRRKLKLLGFSEEWIKKLLNYANADTKKM